MSATASTTSSAGRGRAVLLVVLVAVLAVVAAVATVVVSERTYPPGERTLSAKTQVAAGSEYVDEAAGLVIQVPLGWQAESGGLIFGSTALVPESDDAGDDGSENSGAGSGAEGGGAEGTGAESGAGGVVFIGALTPEMLGGQEIGNDQAALLLANSIGQTFLPVPVQPADERFDQIETSAGAGVALSFRALPVMQPEMLGPEGALVYSAVVGEGDSRFWLTYVGLPADGSIDSPRVEWAEEIVERFRAA